MRITSKEQAFEILDTKRYGIPFDAIEYLYNHKKNPEILDKIAFSLENAYNESIYYDFQRDFYFSTPIWYAIVAENHVDPKLVNSLIKLFTTKDDDWDILNEQGGYLIDQFCIDLGDEAVEQFMNAFHHAQVTKNEGSYLYLLNCLNYANPEKYHDLILDFLNDPETEYIDVLVAQICDARLIKILPRLRELLAYYQKKEDHDFLIRSTIIELEAGIVILENELKGTKAEQYSHHENRGDWKKHYKFYQKHFAAPIQTVAKESKIGRNDPCKCGSGKKYKKCCWPD